MREKRLLIGERLRGAGRVRGRRTVVVGVGERVRVGSGGILAGEGPSENVYPIERGAWKEKQGVLALASLKWTELDHHEL